MTLVEYDPDPVVVDRIAQLIRIHSASGAAQTAEVITLEFANIAHEQAVEWTELADGDVYHVSALLDFTDHLRGTL